MDSSIRSSYVGNGPSGSIKNLRRPGKGGFTAFAPSPEVRAQKHASLPNDTRPKQPRTGQNKYQRRPLRPDPEAVDQPAKLKRLEHQLLLFLEGRNGHL